jgi:CO/xanthine dehydrogenase FAD-binding subunit
MLHRPGTLDAALALLAAGNTVLLAGGTDVYPGLRDAPPPARMIDLTGIPDLRGITRLDGNWRLGAATTWTDVIRADLPPLFDGVKLAAREVGSVQIQNTGTLVGNICNASPAADGIPALLAIDTQVEVIGPKGTRILPLTDFLQAPRAVDLAKDEIVFALLIPATQGRGAFRKLGARRYLVISIAMIGAVIETEGDTITGARIAVGSCSPIAQRLGALEQTLSGAKIAEVARIVADTAMPELSPIDDVRASAAYRLDAVRTLTTRTILDACEVSHVA